MKVLIISNNGLSNNESNGRILSLLFNNFNNESLYSYCLGGKLDKEDVNYIRMNDKRNIKSLLSFGYIKPETNIVIDKSVNNVSNESTIKNKKAIHYFIRNILYSMNFYITNYLYRYIKDNKIESIFLFGADAAYMFRLSRKLSKKCHIPLIIYTCEDYPIKDYNYIEKGKHNNNIFFKLLMSSLRKQTRKAYLIASKSYFNSEFLMKDYMEVYKVNNPEVRYLPSILERVDYRPRPIRNIVYGGNLYLDRVKSLIDVSDVLDDINKEVVINVYGNASNDALTLLKTKSNIIYHGVVDYKTMIEIYKKADMLLHVEGFSEYSFKDYKHAFSTKIADYYKLGIPFFMYSPIEIASTRYAMITNSVYVATSRDMLSGKLKSIIGNNVIYGIGYNSISKDYSPLKYEDFTY